MRIGALYPFHTFAGGGEKYFFGILSVLNKLHDVEILSPFTNDYKHIASLFRIPWNQRQITSRIVPATYLYGLALDAFPFYKKKYDLFISIGNSVIPLIRGLGRKNIYYLQFPFMHAISNSLAQKILIKKRISTYDLIIANSNYANSWIQRRLNMQYNLQVPIKTIYPYITPNMFSPDLDKKNIIFSVGRFFDGDHNKKHQEMIHAFTIMCKNGLKGWELHLAGSTRPEPKHQEYLRKLKISAESYPIYFHFDCSQEDIVALYAKTKIYWHATGLNENSEENPEKMEHFGIAIIEAMAAGAVPIVYKYGGPPEIVTHKSNGMLFVNQDELISYTLYLIRNHEKRVIQAKNALDSIKRFSYSSFTQNVISATDAVMASVNA